MKLFKNVSFLKHVFFGCLLCLWIAVTLFLGYNFFQEKKELSSQDEVQMLQKTLARFIEFNGIYPSVATIIDAEKLKRVDDFYTHSQNGDKLVVWEKKALIYRPSADKIIDFGIVVQAKEKEIESLTTE